MVIKNNATSTGNEGTQTLEGSEGGAGSGASEGQGDDQAPEGAGDSEALDDSKFDDRTKAYIAKLRKENAKYRTAAKTNENLLNDTRSRLSQIAGGDADEPEAPEVQIERLSNHVGALEFERALLELAVERGIDKGGMSYFRFLVADATSKLEEGEEMADDMLDAIASEVQAKTGKTQRSTSVGTGEGGRTPPASGDTGGVTVQKFSKMSVVEKSELFVKNRALYDQLVSEAKEKKILI